MVTFSDEMLEEHRKFWTRQLDSLAAFLESPHKGGGSEQWPNEGGEPQ